LAVERTRIKQANGFRVKPCHGIFCA